MVFHIAVCSPDAALRSGLERQCMEYFARRQDACIVQQLPDADALLRRDTEGERFDLYLIELGAVAAPAGLSAAAELRRRGIACAGMPAEQGKLTAPAIDGWETMADFVLVEADGSAGRPFKAHADWEPVLPEERQATVLVMGADGFGKPISRMAHRPELYARLAGATEDQEVTPELAARVVRLECLHDRVFLNQVDREEEWPLARRLAAALDCPVTAGTLREGRWQRLK